MWRAPRGETVHNGRSGGKTDYCKPITKAEAHDPRNRGGSDGAAAATHSQQFQHTYCA